MYPGSCFSDYDAYAAAPRRMAILGKPDGHSESEIFSSYRNQSVSTQHEDDQHSEQLSPVVGEDEFRPRMLSKDETVLRAIMIQAERKERLKQREEAERARKHSEYHKNVEFSQQLSAFTAHIEEVLDKEILAKMSKDKDPVFSWSECASFAGVDMAFVKEIMSDEEHLCAVAMESQLPFPISRKSNGEDVRSDDEKHEQCEIEAHNAQSAKYAYLESGAREITRERIMSLKLYDEKHQLEECLLHAINALLGRKAVSIKSLDKICKALAPNKLINSHKSILQTGNYDANVLMSALKNENIDVQWFDARKAAQIDLEKAQFLQCKEKGEFKGFILNTPQKSKFNLLNRRHWLTIKREGGVWYNYDSKQPTPFETSKHAAQFIQSALKENKAELMICRAAKK